MNTRTLSAIVLAACLASANMAAYAKQKIMQIKIVETTDVHGSFFPYDFITRQPKQGTLARVSTYMKQLRKEYGDNVLLLENGDILQGQPTCYFYNYVNTGEENIAARLMNYLKYDAATVGNHDIETGHAVYDKWANEVECPMLGANIIDDNTQKSYFLPYTVFEREGAKIAVVGMLTPAIPNWLTHHLWEGMHFEEMQMAAKRTIAELKSTVKPDVIIGLFHSGRDGGITTPEYKESASIDVAKNVDGFDVVFFGHDHTQFSQTITNNAGHEVVCLNPANNALFVAQANLTLEKNKGKWIIADKSGELVDVKPFDIDNNFMEYFKADIDKINGFVNRKIGEFKSEISSKESFFGSCAFNDLILNLELKITGADIAFNAPLSINSTIKKGPVYVSDMFNLYKYENQLYVMKLTGKEIRNHLEMSYDLWVNTMKSPDEHILLLNNDEVVNHEKLMFQNQFFNFDSAAGIDYEVDVTKPDGEKVRILRMSNGEPFDEDKWYKVALNSYRGNGGGELLTRGAGIPHDSLDSRIIYRSEKDQRYYLMQEIERQGTLDPKPNNNWRFVPEDIAKPAIERDMKLIK